MSITDTAIIGNISINATESLAAVGIVGAFISMLVWVLGQIRSAISSIVSQYLGANSLKEIETMPAQAIFIVLMGSILVIGISYPFSRQIFEFYNASGIILEACLTYFNIRIFGLPFSLFVFAVFGIFRGLQNTFYPMLIAIIGALLNVFLDIALVYGIEGLLLPMHLKGAAYASVIAQVSMALMALILLRTKTDISLKVTFPFHPETKRLLGMVLNLFVRTLALNTALYFGTSYATSYGKEYIAAYTIALNSWFLGAFIIDGYSSAGSILSGKILGQKDYRSLLKLSKKLVLYGFLTGVFIMLLGVVFYQPIGRIFTNEPLVLKQFYNSFWMVLIMQPICAITFVFDAMFKGMGKMKFLRNVLLISTGFFYIPALLITDFFDLKLYAIWTAFFIWMIARGLPLVIRFRKTFLPLSRASHKEVSSN